VEEIRTSRCSAGIELSVPEGSAFALIGANGAGKTTTIKVLMNIIEPSRGSATMMGVDSRKISPRELRQIGYVSENQEQGLGHPSWGNCGCRPSAGLAIYRMECA
jgi:ABC-type multidrug transport system ATPase subunit